MRRRRSPGAVVLNVLIVVASAAAVYPFLLMVFGSLKSMAELASNSAGLPTPATLANFRDLTVGFAGDTMVRGFLNSVFVTTVHTALTVLVAAMAGYAFAKYRFPGRQLVFSLLIASMLIPAEVNTPPLYLMFARIDWLDTYWVLIIPGIANVLMMFLVRQFMVAMPDELLEAARVDGAGHWQVFRHVALPLSAPVLGAVAVFTFVAKWTEYLWPQTMMRSPELQPVMVLLPTLNRSQSTFIVPQELILAGCVIVTVPLMAVFLRYRDKLMSGGLAGAVKG